MLCSCSFAKNDDKMMESKDIIKLINKGKPVQIVDRIITDDIDFSTVENQSVDANANINHIVDQDIIFVKCVFLGKVTTHSKKNRITHKTRFMGDVSFRTCDFRGETDFSESVFNGALNFAQSVFREKTNLDNIQVKGNSSQFWEMQAEKDFSMVNSKTTGSLNFMDAKFNSVCLLQQTNCEKLQFSNVKCDSLVDLSMSHFQGNVFMNYCEFVGPLFFNNCNIACSMDMLKSEIKKDFTFDNTIFYGQARFNGTKFAAVSAKDVYFLISPKFENIETNSPIIVNKVGYSTLEIK